MTKKTSLNPNNTSADDTASLRRNVSLLGRLLGGIIRKDQGDDFFNQIETIRQFSKSARKGSYSDHTALLKLLKNLSDDQLVPVARAFSHFLNLANIAEQFHSTRSYSQDPLDNLLNNLKDRGMSPGEIMDAVSQLNVEVVLTAHPTEVTRRTLIQKYEKIIQCLEALNLPELTLAQISRIKDRLQQLIAQAWHTHEFRTKRPSPVDEARGGFATVENSLWEAVPLCYRAIDKQLQNHTGLSLPVDACPIRFSSWIGGDRDGNPFVTAQVTKEVLRLSRWMAADLYLRDLQELINELSMSRCNDSLRSEVGNCREPYRTLLKKLRERLKQTQKYYEQPTGSRIFASDIITTKDSLIAPLQLCYQSLTDCGMEEIANGPLLDMIRRAHCFGLTLLKLDIRQEAERHTRAISELTQALGMGDYHQWDEQKRQNFLLKELQNLRPLLPGKWQPSPETREVLDTCRTIAEEGQHSVGAYVISMASQPSDILAVALLLKVSDVDFHVPIAPLFETLDALENSENCIRQLLNIPFYKQSIQGKQMVMIGYSDSAKDAGWMSAGWVQYRAMDSIAHICRQHSIDLTLFHGRGGTIGRGGGPAHSAILSQPPGSVNFHLRVTEQGEMIRFKLGFPDVAKLNLLLYASATLEASLLPPPAPEPQWCNMMDTLSADALKTYRGIIREEPDFIPYFRFVTPEQELAKLPLGSRPARRKTDGGIESLRAIPWIFAWTQIRLMLPTWLGCGVALRNALDNHQHPLLKEMVQNWPFFRARMEMLEMVFMKTDPKLALYYEERLVPDNLRPLGDKLRAMLKEAIEALIPILDGKALMDSEPMVREAINLRNPYTDPLNFLQAELLCRVREKTSPESPNHLEQALMITMGGIAAGMRNTG
ncbi:Phosphoenolpyruvate carboxylase [invertebrate metagenome]|uniref:phosphoenolpyruvate carboxylase n=1 Tax=invertebrate metagenome TaxID=1711999 RepID=A0A2H9TC31_9ZZZZ